MTDTTYDFPPGTPVTVEFTTNDGTDTRQGYWEGTGRGGPRWIAADGPAEGHPTTVDWEAVVSITPVEPVYVGSTDLDGRPVALA